MAHEPGRAGSLRAGSLPYWIDLEPGEGVLFHELPDRLARIGSYLATLGLFELWRKRTHFVVTSRRLIAVRGVVSRDQQVIPLELINGVTVRRRAAAASLDVATAGGALGTQPVGPLGREQANRLAATIEEARRAANPS